METVSCDQIVDIIGDKFSNSTEICIVNDSAIGSALALVGAIFLGKSFKVFPVTNATEGGAENIRASDLVPDQLRESGQFLKFCFKKFNLDLLDQDIAISFVSSGTTSEPKVLFKLLSDLATKVNRSMKNDACWGLVYQIDRIAGILVILQALGNRASVVCGDVIRLSDLIGGFIAGGVTCLSLTPSVARNWLMDGQFSELMLSQVTLGGELVDARVLNALRRTFPNTKLTHIYATSETGAVFSVTDGLHGFPLDYLARESHRLKIENGTLHVAMVDPLTKGPTWFDTGDKVMVEGERVLFVGRDINTISVGGVKVNLDVLEDFLADIEMIDDVFVSYKGNSLLGNIVTVEIVWAEDCDQLSMKQEIHRRILSKFGSESWCPAQFTTCDQIERRLSVAGKLQRKK